MTYVRTKDGIYEANSRIKPEKELQIKWIDDHCFETSWKTKPCEWIFADTVEELCDAFVYKNKIVELVINKEKPEYSYIWVEIDDNTPFCTRRLTYLNDLEEALKGAIWTDQGLIYKAKMKGVLPNGEIDWELL